MKVTKSVLSVLVLLGLTFGLVLTAYSAPKVSNNKGAEYNNSQKKLHHQNGYKNLNSHGGRKNAAPFKGQKMVTVCQKGQTITVARPALRALIRQGATFGACSNNGSPST